MRKRIGAPRIGAPRIGALPDAVTECELTENIIAVDLVSKFKAKAPIWKHFGFKSNENQEPENPNEAICKLCNMKVAAAGGNTSNLHTHTSNCTTGAKL